MKEERKVNCIVGKAGGTAGSKSLNYKVAIPSTWANGIGITKDSKELLIEFDGEKIILKKM